MDRFRFETFAKLGESIQALYEIEFGQKKFKGAPLNGHGLQIYQRNGLKCLELGTFIDGKLFKAGIWITHDGMTMLGEYE